MKSRDALWNKCVRITSILKPRTNVVHHFLPQRLFLSLCTFHCLLICFMIWLLTPSCMKMPLGSDQLNLPNATAKCRGKTDGTDPFTTLYIYSSTYTHCYWRLYKSPKMPLMTISGAIWAGWMVGCCIIEWVGRWGERGGGRGRPVWSQPLRHHVLNRLIPSHCTTCNRRFKSRD